MSQVQTSMGVEQPRTFWQAVAGSARRASLSAVVMSVVVHVCFLVIAMLMVVGGGGGGDGTGGGDPGPVQMAVVTEGELAQLQDRAMGLQTPSVPDGVTRDVSVDIHIPDAGPVEGGSESLGEIGTLTGGGDISLGGGGGSGLGGSGGGGASFFGLEAQGNRFAYIVDISGSMQENVASANEGTRLMALKAELSRSINGLLENSQFMVVAFSSDANPLTDKREWVEASPSGKRRVAPLIYAMEAQGGTNPLPAFEIVFAVKPRPDAIYFMTDGEFDPSTVEAVAALNKAKVPVHCICLGPAAGTENMRKIAKMSKGTFIAIGGKP